MAAIWYYLNVSIPKWPWFDGHRLLALNWPFEISVPESARREDMSRPTPEARSVDQQQATSHAPGTVLLEDGTILFSPKINLTDMPSNQ